MTAPAIVVDDVSKRFRLYRDRTSSLKELVLRRAGSRYEEFWAVRGVSLEVPKGCTYGLIGHNGSGKSTLLRVMAGIHRPTSGSVSITGRVSALLELGAGFHPELSGRENVYLNGAILGMSRRDIDERIDHIIDFSGLDSFIDSPVKVYSSGMYVRLGFSVAVHVDPEILIIDEVIAVGDEDFQRRCFDHLYKLRRQGVTIVVVSHSLGLMQTLCDEVAWLDHGQLQQIGPAPEVVRAYTTRVNEAELERIESGAEGLGGQPRMEHDLDDGQRPITIEKVEVLDGDGVPTSATHPGHPLTIRVHYDARRPVEAPIVSFALEDAAGLHLANPTVRTADLAADVVVDGPGHVDYVIPELSLAPGEYLISLAIHDAHGMVRLDYKSRMTMLHVQPGERAVIGKVDLLGHWSGPTASNGDPR